MLAFNSKLALNFKTIKKSLNCFFKWAGLEKFGKLCGEPTVNVQWKWFKSWRKTMNFFTDGRRTNRPKFHLARHVSTRSTCRASRDERVEPCCSNMADDEQAILLVCTSLVVFMLLHTQILFVPSNEINVYSNKLVNNLHIITLYKLYNKLSCVSSS